MADEPTTTPAAGTTPVRPKSLGRRIALAIYLTFMLYIAVVGFSSVIPQVFWPETHTDAAAPEGSCGETMVALRDALRDEAASYVSGDEEDLQPFLARWDDQYLHIRERCEGVDAYTRLGILRHRVDTTLRQFGRVEGRLFAELDDLNTAHPP